MSFSDLIETAMTAALMTMNNITMKYKDFTFPSNPSVLEVITGKKLTQNALPDKHSTVEEICSLPVKIKGNGVFYGEGARQACVELARLLKKKSSGWLFCPDANPVEAYFVSFTYKLDSKKGCASYSFEFVEAENDIKCDKTLRHIIAKSGDNAFIIANRHGLSVTDIMRLNDFCTPFDILEGDEVRLR